MYSWDRVWNKLYKADYFLQCIEKGNLMLSISLSLKTSMSLNRYNNIVDI